MIPFPDDAIRCEGVHSGSCAKIDAPHSGKPDRPIIRLTESSAKSASIHVPAWIALRFRVDRSTRSHPAFRFTIGAACRCWTSPAGSGADSRPRQVGCDDRTNKKAQGRVCAD